MVNPGDNGYLWLGSGVGLLLTGEEKVAMVDGVLCRSGVRFTIEEGTKNGKSKKTIKKRAVNSSEPANESEAKTPQVSTNSQPATSATSTPPPPKPKKPVYSMKKGQIVRVDKEKYLNSVNYLSVGHPPFYKGLDYIYEDRGEVLDLRIFETGEYALIGWVGIPTAPAWLPTDMLIKSDKLDYERI
ncbi:OLC1v1008609C1 [Oldenlandia corymbosa var. corymbosa]|uniref:OLC1v1008609C1 n=1 Tax=Oldenlandia corymbosa var. corymbosa TaxID=529605 RepID=A0AAV1DMJ6_OLDCO|nr:OLC1v1008609C1 [Oldenlandia corymbosa var. corymbosa]